MASLFLVNRSQQDVTTTVTQEGKRRPVTVPKGGTMLLSDAAPTPELEAIHKSKNLDFVYQVRD